MTEFHGRTYTSLIELTSFRSGTRRTEPDGFALKGRQKANECLSTPPALAEFRCLSASPSASSLLATNPQVISSMRAQSHDGTIGDTEAMIATGEQLFRCKPALCAFARLVARTFLIVSACYFHILSAAASCADFFRCRTQSS